MKNKYIISIAHSFKYKMSQRDLQVETYQLQHFDEGHFAFGY